MTAREKAIEAAARGIALGQTGSPDEAPVYRLDAESAVRNAAPLIESALLDRIGKVIEVEQETLQGFDAAPFDRGYRTALFWVMDRLTEIREEE